MTLTTIYYLHRGDNIPFYIGKTTNITYRLYNHKIFFGKDIKMEVISEVNNWKRWEKYYIKKYTDLGYKLENKNNGGGGVDIMSQETKDKISNANKGKKRNPEFSDKISKINKGKKVSQETKDKISKGNVGNKLSQEAKDKIRKSKLGNKLSQETKDKISKANKGKPKHTPKSKESIKKSRLGTKVSQEIKDKIYTEERNSKISKANKNRDISHEWREKMSLAKKGKPSSASKPIIQYSLKNEYIKEWNSIAEAKRWLGSGDIQGNVLGRTKSAGGFIWRYKK